MLTRTIRSYLVSCVHVRVHVATVVFRAMSLQLEEGSQIVALLSRHHVVIGTKMNNGCRVALSTRHYFTESKYHLENAHFT